MSKSKMKAHKGMRKRAKVTATGKVRYKRSFAGHLMSGKSGDRVRRLRRPGFVTKTLARKIRPVIDE
jgi:large subunit ribosomal protein L35